MPALTCFLPTVSHNFVVCFAGSFSSSTRFSAEIVQGMAQPSSPHSLFRESHQAHTLRCSDLLLSSLWPLASLTCPLKCTFVSGYLRLIPCSSCQPCFSSYFPYLHLSSSCAKQKSKNHPFSYLLLNSYIPSATKSCPRTAHISLTFIFSPPLLPLCQDVCSSQCSQSDCFKTKTC